jgi:hypothetical protein
MAGASISPGRIVAFSALTEAATGLALIGMPALVFSLLIGGTLAESAVPLARILGIALLALGIACWPERVNASVKEMNALLVYNALVAIYLGYVGAALNMGGILLWPAVGIHAIVAAMLIWSRRN